MPDLGLDGGLQNEAYAKGMPGAYSVYDRERPAIFVRRFFRKWKPDPNDPTKGTEEHWVEIGKPGEANWATPLCIDRLKPRPDRGKPAAIEWAVIGPAYEAWLKGEEAPQEGTPLYAWPGIPREAVDKFKEMHVTTVEHLALFPDDKLGKLMMPKAREWRDRAKAYVAAKKDDAAGLGHKMHALEEANKRLADEAAEKNAQLQNALDRLAALERAASPQPEKRGPGRPRKVTDETDGDAEPGTDA